MIYVMTRGRLKQLLQQEREASIIKGYELGWMMKQIDNHNRGFIISNKVNQEIDNILKGKGI